MYSCFIVLEQSTKFHEVRCWLEADQWHLLVEGGTKGKSSAFHTLLYKGENPKPALLERIAQLEREGYRITFHTRDNGTETVPNAEFRDVRTWLEGLA
jgi:hypothetical protein